MAVLGAACSQGASVAPVDAGGTEVAVPRCALAFNGDATVLLRTSEQRVLQIAVDPARSGIALRAALVGPALDASLAATDLVTGNDGTAAVNLTAPTGSTTFRVRVTASCGGEAYANVAVGDRGFGGIAAEARYEGARSPTSLGLGVVPGAACPTMLTGTSTRVSLPGGIVRFGALPADLAFTVWGAAYGDDGAVLAQGCAPPQVIRSAGEAMAAVTFVDAPLRASGSYVLALHTDLAGTAPTAVVRWVAPVLRDVAATGSSASYLAAVISAALATGDAGAASDAGNVDAGALGEQGFDAAVRAGLGARLDDALLRRGADLPSAFGALAATTLAALRAPRWSLDLGTAPAGMTGWAVTGSRAVLDPGTPDVNRDDALVDLGAMGHASMELHGADVLTVRVEGVALPWTRLARAALGAVTARAGAASTGEYVAAQVCPVAAAVLAEAAPCGDACVRAACRRAVDVLAQEFDGAVASELMARSSADFVLSASAAADGHTLSVGRAEGAGAGQWFGEPGTPLAPSWTLQRTGGP